MAGVNGRADVVGPPIQLGDFLPERRQVSLNGQSYTAWVTTNNRYPRSIMARLDRAARVYNRVIAPLLEPRPEPLEGEAPEPISPERIKAVDEQPEAWEVYVNECVMLLVPGLLESEIELVDLTTLEELLRTLGYFRTLEKVDIDSGETTESDPLTGATEPLDSPTSIPATT